MLLIEINNAFLRTCAVLVNAIFWISVRRGFPGFCCKYLFVLFFTVPRAIANIDVDFGFRYRVYFFWIPSSFYFDIFPKFLSIGNISSTIKHELFLWSLTVVIDLLASIFLSVCNLKSQKIVALFVSTIDFLVYAHNSFFGMGIWNVGRSSNGSICRFCHVCFYIQ